MNRDILQRITYLASAKKTYLLFLSVAFLVTAIGIASHAVGIRSKAESAPAVLKELTEKKSSLIQQEELLKNDLEEKQERLDEITSNANEFREEYELLLSLKDNYDAKKAGVEALLSFRTSMLGASYDTEREIQTDEYNIKGKAITGILTANMGGFGTLMDFSSDSMSDRSQRITAEISNKLNKHIYSEVEPQIMRVNIKHSRLKTMYDSLDFMFQNYPTDGNVFLYLNLLQQLELEDESKMLFEQEYHEFASELVRLHTSLDACIEVSRSLTSVKGQSDRVSDMSLLFNEVSGLISSLGIDMGDYITEGEINQIWLKAYELQKEGIDLLYSGEMGDPEITLLNFVDVSNGSIFGNTRRVFVLSKTPRQSDRSFLIISEEERVGNSAIVTYYTTDGEPFYMDMKGGANAFIHEGKILSGKNADFVTKHIAASKWIFDNIYTSGFSKQYYSHRTY